MSVEPCSSSIAYDMEQVGSESSRRFVDRRDKRKRKRGVGVWKQRVKLEATAPWSRMKSISVYLEGESCYGQARAKMRESNKNGREGRGEDTW